MRIAHPILKWYLIMKLILLARHSKARRTDGFLRASAKRSTFRNHKTLAQDRAGWLKLITKVPFDIGKPWLRPPQCDTRVTPEEKRGILARRAKETEQRRALFKAEIDAHRIRVQFWSVAHR